MEIELGLIAAVALMGAAVQFRIVTVLQIRLKQIAEDLRRRDEELEARAASRFGDIERDREEWEKRHGGSGNSGNRASVSVPLLLAGDTPMTPDTPSTKGRPLSSVLSLGGRLTTPVAEYFNNRPATPDPDRPPQTPGLLPTLDLGKQVKKQLPEDMISKTAMVDDHPEIRERKKLLNEIGDIRRSIDALSSNSHGEKDARLSLGDLDATRSSSEAAATARLRVLGGSGNNNNTTTGRDRVRSMFAMPTARPISALTTSPDQPRPKSTPLENDEWNTYVSERKLFRPPAGVTPPIVPSPLPEALLQRAQSARLPMPDAVSAALEGRKRRESLFDMPTSRLADPVEDDELVGGFAASSAGGGDRRSWLGPDLELGASAPGPSRTLQSPPVARPEPMHVRSGSSAPIQHQQHQVQQAPLTVLPPRRDMAPPSPPPARVLTYEEMQERHKSRMRKLQEPLTKAAAEEATLADARARWERSKSVEKVVMERRYVEKAAVADAKLKEREKEKEKEKRGRRGSRSPGPRLDLDAAEASGSGDVVGGARPRQSKHRSSMSLEKLKSVSGANPISPSSKVEEWQRQQLGSVAPDSTDGSGHQQPRSDEHRHRRSNSTPRMDRAHQ